MAPEENHISQKGSTITSRGTQRNLSAMPSPASSAVVWVVRWAVGCLAFATKHTHSSIEKLFAQMYRRILIRLLFPRHLALFANRLVWGLLQISSSRRDLRCVLPQHAQQDKKQETRRSGVGDAKVLGQSFLPLGPPPPPSPLAAFNHCTHKYIDGAECW